jgi:alkylation response protein AidB-like acyl-CoA dehydrogenase
VTPVDGGFRVTGRWPFASGCQHCQWLVGGGLIPDHGGTPALRLFLFPTAEVEVIDTWHVAGLAGTGSHDIAVQDVFVPYELTVAIPGTPQHGGALYGFPVFGLLAVGVASVALGIARAAIDELVELAGAKRPTMTRRTLAERPLVQLEVARATAGLGGARANLLDAVERAWRAAQDGGQIAVVDRARIRAAACYATEAAVRVVDAMYTAGGGTSIYAGSPLQRHLRDIHVVTQHAMVGPTAYETAGRVLLGLDSDTSLL